MSPSHSKHVTAAIVALVGVGMFFAALFSACIVDKGAASGGWLKLPLPHVLWVNTVLLLASSGAMIVSGLRFRSGTRSEFRRWWGVSAVLGCAFVLGQLWVWRQLLAEGIGFATSTSSSFFYLLVAAHAACVVGGIVALVVAALRFRNEAAGGSAVKAISIYWHAVAALWLVTFFFLLAIL